MFSRIASIATLALSFALLSSPVSAFVDVKMHDGKVVSVTAASNGGDAKLRIRDHDGKDESTFSIPSTVKVMLDNKEAKLTDLKAGDAVQITTDIEGQVTAVEASRAKA